jgi:hypothetical protein
VITVNHHTYTVTASTTLTITNCPCTVTSSVELPAPTGNLTSIPNSPTVTASLFPGAGSALGRDIGVVDKLVAVALGIVAML